MAEKKSGVSTILIVVVVGLGFLVVVCGILAAIAIPAFMNYIRAAKTAEAHANLVSLYSASAGYYANENFGSGPIDLMGAGATTACTVGSARTSNTPSPELSVLGAMPPEFEAIGFSLYDPVYFQYEIVGDGRCNHQAGDPLYTFRAYGDLDGDGTTSMFELTVTADPNNDAMRAPSIREVDPTE